MQLARDDAMRNSQDSRRSNDTTRTDSNPNSGDQSIRPLGYTQKVEFPKFNGANAETWVKKCVKYFSLCKPG